MIAATATSISSIKKDNFNWISYLNCAMFGLQDGVINIHTLSTLGFEFEFKSQVFALFILIQSLSALLSWNLQNSLNILDDQSKLLNFTIIVNVFGILSIICSYFFPYKTSREMKRKDFIDQHAIFASRLGTEHQGEIYDQ